LSRLGKGISGRLGSFFNNPYRKVNLSWLAVKYYKHLSGGKIRSHKLLGHAFHFYSPQEFLHGAKELFIEDLYRQYLGPNPFIIDCGANMGLSIVYLKHNHPDAEIIAFEPDEVNYGLLSKNIDSFGYKNVTLRKEAVWKENTTLLFSNEGSMSSKITDEQSGVTREVRAIRLRDCIDRPVDFLKIDIEGAEYDVIKDVADRLSLVKNLFIEYHGIFQKENELNEILSIVSENGFKFYIKEAAPVYPHPFVREKIDPIIPYDVQLNIFCFKI
jgi:FkbM family methyltransferase